jgi:hypothetical protein
MKYGEYVTLLDTIQQALVSKAIMQGPAGKNFICANMLEFEDVALRDREFYFLMGDVVNTEGKNRVNCPPYKEGDRIAWTSPRFIKDPNMPVVVHYYIFGEDPEAPMQAISVFTYSESGLEMAADHIYDFIVNGNLPTSQSTRH